MKLKNQFHLIVINCQLECVLNDRLIGNRSDSAGPSRFGSPHPGVRSEHTKSQKVERLKSLHSSSLDPNFGYLQQIAIFCRLGAKLFMVSGGCSASAGLSSLCGDGFEKMLLQNNWPIIMHILMRSLNADADSVAVRWAGRTC